MLHATDKAFLRYHYGRALYMQERYPEAIAEGTAAMDAAQFRHTDSILLTLHAMLGAVVSYTGARRQSQFATAKQLWQRALGAFPADAQLQALDHILGRDTFEE